MKKGNTWQSIFATPPLKPKPWSNGENFLRRVGVVITEEDSHRIHYNKDGVIIDSHHSHGKKKLRSKNLTKGELGPKQTYAANTMTYKEYSGTVEYNQEDDCLFGRVIGIEDNITFEGESVQALHQAFELAVDDYVKYCKKIGKIPQKHYSGKLLLRISPALHAKLAKKAQINKISLNQYIVHVLESL